MDRLTQVFTVPATVDDVGSAQVPSIGTSGPLGIQAEFLAHRTAVNKLAASLQHFLSLESPGENDTRMVFRARAAVALPKIVSVLLGSDTPTVTWKLQVGQSLDALVDLTLPITTSSVTEGDEDEGGNELTPWTGPDGNGEYYAASPNRPCAVESDGDTLTEGTIGELAAGEYGWTASDGGRVYLSSDPSEATVIVNPSGYSLAAGDFLVVVVSSTSGSPAQLLISLELEPA